MNIGDKVKFLNETGGGIITKFLDPETVLVKIEDGFEVPVKLNEIIPDFSKLSDSIQHNKIEVKDVILEFKQSKVTSADNTVQQVLSKPKNSGQVYLAFTHNGNPNHLITHLINDTDYHIYYISGLRKMGQQLYQYSGSLEPNTKIVLGNYKISKIDEPTIFSIQYMGFKKGYYVPFEPVNRIIEIDTQKLVDRHYEKENDFFDNDASIFTLSVKNISENLKFSKTSLNLRNRESLLEKEKSLKKKIVTEKQKTPEIMEVDLHINEIVEDTSGLTDGEILDIQLRRFEMSLETALHGNIKKIVFIHGVGQGKLKYEISKIMDLKYPDLKYQDASFKEYGYGATMVFI